jgi:hypothetical protein
MSEQLVDQAIAVEPENPSATPEEQTAPLWQSIGRTAVRAVAKTVLAAAVLSPVAAGAGITSIALAPEAHIPVSIAGADITAQLDRGSDVVTTNLQAVDVDRHSNAKIGSKDIGATVNFHFNKISVSDGHGGYDFSKLKSVYQEFSNIDPEVATIQSSMESHYIKWGLGGVALVYGSALAIGGWVALRRRQLNSYPEDKRQHAIEDRQWARRAGIGVLVLGSATMVASGASIYFAPNHPRPIEVDHALDKTVLAGSGVRGIGKPIVDNFFPTATQYINTKNAFYERQGKNFNIAFQAKYGAKSVHVSNGNHVVVFGEDPQGEDGVMAVLGDAAQSYNASAILLGGDITATGLPIETPVLDTLKAHAKKIPVLVNLAHHDSPAVAQIAEERKFTVTNGKVQTVGGVKFIGVNAPVPIPLWEPDPLTNPDPVNHELAQSIIDQACTSKTPVIAEMHDNKIGTEVAKANCPNIPLVLTGRSFNASQPITRGNTTEVISGSIGGHDGSNKIELYGIIRHDGTFQAITIDKNSQFVSEDLITLHATPDAAVTITDVTPKQEAVVTPPQSRGSSNISLIPLPPGIRA